MGLNPQLVGNVGLYHVCLKLSLLGWNVMPTARNARGIDLIAYSEDATRIIGVQVKALSQVTNVLLGGSLDRLMGDWWVIVAGVALENPIACIMLPSEVRDAAHVSRNGATYWLQSNAYKQERYQEAWSRIGHGGLDQPVG